jgi:hypothetical protein
MNHSSITTPEELEALVTHHLTIRGLARAPGRQLAFAHKGQPVVMSIDPSPYTGFILTVHDRGKPLRQFRPRAGEYDWNAVAGFIAEIASNRLFGRRLWSRPEVETEDEVPQARQRFANTRAG